jgi:hypothetical protein
MRRTLGVVPEKNLIGLVGSQTGIMLSLGLVVLLGLTATFVPLLLGIRAFRRFEP